MKFQMLLMKKAVELVTEKAVEETHNMDFDVIIKHKDTIMSPKSKNSPQVKSIGSQVLDSLMKKFGGLTEHISRKLREVFKNPETKEEMKKPIKQSIRERLSQSKSEADARNAKHPKKHAIDKKQNKEL